MADLDAGRSRLAAVPDGANAGPGGRSTIWSLARPLPMHVHRQDLYADLHRASYSPHHGGFRIKAGGRIVFDRLLNLFAHRKWRTLAKLADLGLAVTYRGGACRVSVLGFDGSDARLVSAFTLDASAETTTFELSLPQGVHCEFLYLQFDADASTDVLDAAFVTRDRPANAIRLGIAITTFNRQEDVEMQVGLLEALQEDGLDYQVLVIDNGSNLKLQREYAHTRVLPSPNLGGAGGFTRGLLAFADAGEMTHVMFMDDDAYCHPTAILRAVALLRFADDPRLAFTGAMNYLHAPELQYELGGKLVDYGVASIRMNVDTSGLKAAFENEKADAPQYGAWWCFIFPLAAVDTLPFPFFVRGDDIAFSLQNRFNLRTMPGLLAWQPSFEFKIGAPVEYLAHRSFLTLPLLAAREKWTRASVVNGVRHAFVSEVDGLRYPIAEGICAALEDVLTGPSFWNNTANTVARMQELGRLEKSFTDRSYLPNWLHRPKDGEGRRSMRILRARFGHLNLPARLCWRRPVLTNEMFPRRGQAAFRTGMIYFAPDGSKAMSCRRDWRWRRRLERRFEGLISEYEGRFSSLTATYARGKQDLQSAETWRSRFAGAQPELPRAHPAL